MEADVGVAIDNVEGKIPTPSSSRGGEACDQPHEQGHTPYDTRTLPIDHQVKASLDPPTKHFTWAWLFISIRDEHELRLSQVLRGPPVRQTRWSWRDVGTAGFAKPSCPSERAISQADRAGKAESDQQKPQFQGDHVLANTDLAKKRARIAQGHDPIQPPRHFDVNEPQGSPSSSLKREGSRSQTPPRRPKSTRKVSSNDDNCGEFSRGTTQKGRLWARGKGKSDKSNLATKNPLRTFSSHGVSSTNTTTSSWRHSIRVRLRLSVGWPQNMPCQPECGGVAFIRSWSSFDINSQPRWSIC